MIQNDGNCRKNDTKMTQNDTKTKKPFDTKTHLIIRTALSAGKF